MSRRGVLLVVLLLLWVVPVVVLAQTDCPTLVAAALESTNTACEATGRNQACYGNILLEATTREESVDFSFEEAGDTAEVAAIDTLRLSSFNASSGEWGVALMQVQANIPDDVPEDVTFLLFGDVQIENTAEDPIEVPLPITQGVNVRLRPATDGAVLGSVRAGETVVATGQFTTRAGETWLRIQFTGDKRGVGWIIGWSVSEDISTLEVVEPSSPAFGPMQAFLFRSGADDRACEEAPDSGLLIQTPEGVGEISLLVNEVDVQLGSTAYLQAQPSSVMTVSVVEGQAQVTAQGVTQLVPAGSRVLIPLDAAGVASAPPPTPEPYDNAVLAALPIGLLGRSITVAAALTQDEIDELIAPDTQTAAPSAPSSPGG